MQKALTICLGLLMLAAGTVNGMPPVFSQFSGNPIVSSTPTGVVFQHGASEYRLFFASNGWNPIYLKKSSDGVVWSTVSEPVIDSTLSGKSMTYSNVAEVKVDGVYHIWFSSTNDGNVAGTKLYYATSNDGESFIGHGMVLDNGVYPAYDSRNINHPSVLYDGSIFHLYYNAFPGYQSGPPDDSFNYTIAYATSPDGINWTKHGVILEKGDDGQFDTKILTPHVVYDSGRFEMFYMALDDLNNYSTGYATSSNGLNWTKNGKVNNIPNNYALAGAKKTDTVNYKLWHINSGDTNLSLSDTASSVKIAPKIFAWVPSYSRDASEARLKMKLDGDHGPLDTLTHIALQFWKVTMDRDTSDNPVMVTLNYDEQGIVQSDVTKFVNLARSENKDMKVLLSLNQGDTCFDGTKPKVYDHCWEGSECCDKDAKKWMIAEAQYTGSNRTIFIDKIMTIVDESKLDGVDVNFEFEPSSTVEDVNTLKEDYFVFLEELSNRLHLEDKELYVASWPFESTWGAPNPSWYYPDSSDTFKKGLVELTDGIEVMGYQDTGNKYNCSKNKNSHYSEQEKLILDNDDHADLMLGVWGHINAWCENPKPATPLETHIKWFLSNKNKVGIAIWKTSDLHYDWWSKKIWNQLYDYKSGVLYEAPMMNYFMPAILSAATIYIDKQNTHKLKDQANSEE